MIMYFIGGTYRSPVYYHFSASKDIKNFFQKLIYKKYFHNFLFTINN